MSRVSLLLSEVHSLALSLGKTRRRLLLQLDKFLWAAPVLRPSVAPDRRTRILKPQTATRRPCLPIAARFRRHPQRIDAQAARKASSQPARTIIYLYTRWVCATTATINTVAVPWQQIALMPASAPYMPRASVRVATSMTITRCVVASVSSRRSKTQQSQKSF